MENDQVETFILDRVNPQLRFRFLKLFKLVAGIFVVVVIVIVCCGLPLYFIPFCLAALPLTVLIFVILSSVGNNKISQVLELYNDKLIIKGLGGVVINFNEIRFYQKITTKFFILKITMNDGNVIRILDGLNGGLSSFIAAFEQKIKKEVLENQVSITDETSATDGKLLYVIVGLIVCLILCFIASLLVHHRN